MEALNLTLIRAKHIKDWSRKDVEQSMVIDYVLHGRKSGDSPEYKAFRERREELTVHDGCLLRGNRVIVPTAGRQQALDLFHEGHSGASRMKSLARLYIWWRGIDNDIERKVKSCFPCQQHRNTPPVSPLVP